MAPKMAKNGTTKSSDAPATCLRLICENEPRFSSAVLSLLSAANDIANKLMPMVMVNGRIDKGDVMPASGNSVLIRTPTNMMKAMLKPTESSMKLNLLLEFDFIISRMSAPGTNDR